MPNTSNAEITINAPDISREIFGGVLDVDGKGYYPGLELLNFIFGTEGENLLPQDEVIFFRRRAHDFARKLVWDENFHQHPKRRDVLFDIETEEAVRNLMACLQLEIPNTRKKPTWERAHFFPYTQSLIHWDVRKGKKADGIKMERRYYRGGGALAFHILRKDTNIERLELCRKGFGELYSLENVSPLEQLSEVLAMSGSQDEHLLKDKIEQECSLKNDDLENLFRDGMVNILDHKELSTVARLRAIINWTAFWLILMQLSRSATLLQQQQVKIICDCASSHPQLRRASQRCLKSLQSVIADAVAKVAEDKNADISNTQRNKIKGFFTGTAATVKLLNSWSGRRHFTLGLNMLETLVLAATKSTSEIPFDDFIDTWLYERCHIIVGRSAAEKSDLLSSFDASIFEDNENQLATQMSAAGLLTEYSDATKMVSTGGLR